MDWTVGTFWTMGNDALDAGDSRERRRPGGISALSALLPLRGKKMSDRPSSARRAAPCIAPGEAPGGRRNPGYDSKLELRPEGATLARHVASHASARGMPCIRYQCLL